MPTKGNAPLPGKGEFGNTRPHYKRFPAFGKRYDESRQKGLIPVKRVIVSTNWKLGAAFPRIIIAPDFPASNLQFRYLAGLHVQIVYYDRDAAILPELISEILSIQPATLSTFDMSAVKQGKHAFRLIFSQSEVEAPHD